VTFDDEICCCYHVSLRKLVRFAERERPGRPSEMSRCLGAGTGCGWCIPILKEIHRRALAGQPLTAESLEALLPASAEEYASARGAYRGATGKNQF
jgi:bacterioferritin-associated ferredoxin